MKFLPQRSCRFHTLTNREPRVVSDWGMWGAVGRDEPPGFAEPSAAATDEVVQGKLLRWTLAALEAAGKPVDWVGLRTS